MGIPDEAVQRDEVSLRGGGVDQILRGRDSP